MNTSSNFNNTIEYKMIYLYVLTASAVFSIIGLFANAFLLYILIKHEIFGKTTYYLLRISVTSDIICNFTTATAYFMSSGAHIFYLDGTTLCRCLVLTIFASYGVSMMTLCIIAIDRYFVIVRPLSSFYRRYKGQFIRGLFALVAIVVFSSTFPSFFCVTTYPGDIKFCHLTTVTPAISSYLIISTITLYIIPALTLIIIYSKIIIYMKNYVRPGEIISNPDGENHKKKKFIRMLISIATAYLLISWPYFATSLGIAITGRSSRQVRQHGFVYFLLAFFSFSSTTAISILNPFLYFKFDCAIRLKAKIHLSAIYGMVNSRIVTTDNAANNPSRHKSVVT